MISVIMPTYNRSAMMKQAINSVLSQSYDDIEVVVVDDNSSDNTKEVIDDFILKGYNIKYHHNSQNMGPGYNRNKGYTLSKGEYIVFMDDDDYYTNTNFYKKAIDILNANDSVACISANARIENVENQTVSLSDIGFVGLKNGEEYLLGLNKKYQKPLSTFTTIFSKKILERAELSKMKMVNDIAIYMRALVFGDIYVLEDAVGNYRVHGNNISTHIEKNFLIENMKERVWSFRRFKCDIETANKWLNEQLLFCFSYYVRGSHPSGKDCCSIILWILRNTTFSCHLYKGILRILIKERKQNLH